MPLPLSRLALLAAACVSLLAACEEAGVSETRYMTITVPEFTSRSANVANVGVEEPRTLCTPGAIYARGDYLLVNELGEGWHVIDNADPDAPKPTAFWRVAGSKQITWVGDRIVVDSYGDLLLLEADDPLELTVTDVTPNAFTGEYQVPYYAAGTENAVAVDYTDSLVVGFREELREIADDEFWGICFFGVATPVRAQTSAVGSERLLADVAAFSDGGSGFGGGINAGGSLSRYAARGDYLYIAEGSRLATYLISDTIAPTGAEHYVREVETAVVREGYLYLGTPTGMQILDLADPASPAFLSEYTHIRGCDPVAVHGDRAVVTVRDGADCFADGDVNTLTVLDISDRAAPRELSVTRMLHPHGVAIHDARLYVCEGEHGLRVYDFPEDARRPGALLAHAPQPTIDVIPLPYRAGLSVFTVGADGFRQYSPGEGDALGLRSEILRACE